MPTAPRGVGQLHVVADVAVSVDGATATLTGNGADLRLESPDPAGLLDAVAHAELPAAVGRVDGPRALGRVADQLAAVGLTLTVAGPQGDVLSMGDAGGSWAGRLVTGSRQVRMGRWVAVRPLAGAALRRRVGHRPRLAAGVGLAAATTAAGLVVRRRRSR